MSEPDQIHAKYKIRKKLFFIFSRINFIGGVYLSGAPRPKQQEYK